MKTILLITSLFSATAFAQVDIDQALQIRNQKNIQTAPGMAIGQFDVEAVKKAASSIGGKVSIHFGKNDSMVIDQASTRSGGVIVGSGTDGLTKNIVVTPPLRPSMSITVTARAGSINYASKFCIRPKNSVATVNYRCFETGMTQRILDPGTYVVYLATNSLAVSAIEVNMNPGDNVIIPTREIQVGSYPELAFYSLYADYSSNDEMEKLRQVGPNIVVNRYNSGLYHSGHYIDFKEILLERIIGPNFNIFIENSVINKYGRLVLTDKSLPIIDSSIEGKLRPKNPYLDETIIGGSKSSGFFNVLPGTYGIQWQFKDQQLDYTKGIVVE